MDRSTFLQNLLNAFVPEAPKMDKSHFSQKWSGVMRKSVAMQNHRGDCNQKRPHQGKQECARRVRQMTSENTYLFGAK